LRLFRLPSRVAAEVPDDALAPLPPSSAKVVTATLVKKPKLIAITETVETAPAKANVVITQDTACPNLTFWKQDEEGIAEEIETKVRAAMRHGNKSNDEIEAAVTPLLKIRDDIRKETGGHCSQLTATLKAWGRGARSVTRKGLGARGSQV